MSQARRRPQQYQGQGQRPQQQGQRPQGQGQPRDRNPKKITMGQVWNRISLVILQIVVLPVHILKFLTQPPGNAIVLGLAVIYFLGVNVEGYWQAMDSANPSFIPKPFISDDASLTNLFPALLSASFYMAFIISLVIQGIQAFSLREKSIERARRDFDKVAGYRVPETPENAVDIAEKRRLQYKRNGIRTMRQRGLAVLLTYLIDICSSVWNYPLIGQDTGTLFVHFCWAVASVLGTEMMINLFAEAIAPASEQVRQPEVV